jgi:hypothetical protein
VVAVGRDWRWCMLSPPEFPEERHITITNSDFANDFTSLAKVKKLSRTRVSNGFANHGQSRITDGPADGLGRPSRIHDDLPKPNAHSSRIIVKAEIRHGVVSTPSRDHDVGYVRTMIKVSVLSCDVIKHVANCYMGQLFQNFANGRWTRDNLVLALHTNMRQIIIPIIQRHMLPCNEPTCAMF